MKRLFLALCIFVGSTSQAASYYFSPSGSDSNLGTLLKPWQTLDRLVRRSGRH